MPDPQDDVGELQSEGTESDGVEVNGELFKNIKFFLHKSIKKNFSRRNLTRDIKVQHGSHSSNYWFIFVCRDMAELYTTLPLAATQFLSMSCMRKRRYYNLCLTIRTILNLGRSTLNILPSSSIAFGIITLYTE